MSRVKFIQWSRRSYGYPYCLFNGEPELRLEFPSRKAGHKWGPEKFPTVTLRPFGAWSIPPSPSFVQQPLTMRSSGGDTIRPAPRTLVRWTQQQRSNGNMVMDQYLLIPFLGEWTSIYQLFWCSPGG
jgi:hypothetical protein